MSDESGRLASPGPEGDKNPAADAMLSRSILDSAHDAFVSTDANGVVTGWNREAEHTFGFSRVDAVGRDLAELIVADRFRPAHRDAMARFLATGDREVLHGRREINALYRAGDEFPVEMTVSATVSGVANHVAFHLFIRDITERRLADQVLVAMQSVTRSMARAHTPEQALQSLLATLGEGLGWDIGHYWAPAGGALERRAGWTASGLAGGDVDELGGDLRLHARDSFPGRAMRDGEPIWIVDFAAQSSFPRPQAARRAGLRTAICVPTLRDGKRVGVLEFLSRERRVRDRFVCDALVTIGRQAGELLGVLDDRQTLLTSLARLALTDQLTGLPNRRAWEEGLDRELSRAAREGHGLCVAVIDLDDFKSYNDRHGHQAGDDLLTATADAWRVRLRASDLLARYGGEEFAAVITAWPLDAAVGVVDRLRTAVPGRLTCSAGVAGWDRVESARELFARADGALYAAKQAGRDRTAAARP
jgi:diguanylate cyclase (GGDEF)-like protein/PAS domain S-box-containing protein